MHLYDGSYPGYGKLLRISISIAQETLREVVEHYDTTDPSQLM